MVVMCLPAICMVNVRQLLIALPSTKTVQVPHIPIPQDPRAPTSPKLSRRVSRSNWSHGTSSVCDSPFTHRVIDLVIMSRVFVDGLQHSFSTKWQISNAYTNGIVYGICNSRGNWRQGHFADAAEANSVGF